MKMRTIEDSILPGDYATLTGESLALPERRLNVAVITTGSEIIGDEGVGQSRYQGKRLRGTIEHLANLTESDNGFSRAHNLVLVVNDQKHLNGEPDKNYVFPYEAGRPWYESAVSVIRDDEGNENSVSLDSITLNVPSNWKNTGTTKMDKNTGLYRSGDRVEQKTLWEEDLVGLFDQYNVDVVLSDSCVSIFAYGIPEDRGLLPSYEGRILNIHPAKTQGEHAVRGITPTRDVLQRLEETGYRYSGSTLHYLIRQIDAGEVIHSLDTFIPYEIHAIPTEQGKLDFIRHFNYETKNKVASEGLQIYAADRNNRELIMEKKEQLRAVETYDS